jgi:hypothetical protein
VISRAEAGGSHRAGPCAELDLQGVKEEPNGQGHCGLVIDCNREVVCSWGDVCKEAAARTETAKGLKQKARSGCGAGGAKMGEEADSCR